HAPRGGRRARSDAARAAPGGCRALFWHRAQSPLAWRGVVTPAPTCGGAGAGRAGAPAAQRRSTRPVGVSGTQVRGGTGGRPGPAGVAQVLLWKRNKKVAIKPPLPGLTVLHLG